MSRSVEVPLVLKIDELVHHLRRFKSKITEDGYSYMWQAN